METATGGVKMWLGMHVHLFKMHAILQAKGHTKPAEHLRVPHSSQHLSDAFAYYVLLNQVFPRVKRILGLLGRCGILIISVRIISHHCRNVKRKMQICNVSLHFAP
jgi:hypothetical protein